MELPQFDLSTIRTNSNVLITGLRQSGKTVLIHDIVYNLREKFQFGVLMGSPGEHTYLPGCCSFKDLDTRIVDGIMERQMTDKPKHVLCVFDGLLKQFPTPAVREMLLNGMHRNIFSVHSNQYMEPMPGMVRWSFDYVFVTRQTLEESIEKIWKYFASYTMFPDLENFRKVLEEYTEGNRVLVLEPTKMKAYWYEPQLHPPFRVFENDLLWALEKKTN